MAINVFIFLSYINRQNELGIVSHCHFIILSYKMVLLKMISHLISDVENLLK